MRPTIQIEILIILVYKNFILIFFIYFCLMQFFSNIHIPELQPAITYNDAIMLTGSCFTEHIGNHLKNVKFNVLQNPNGILFDPISVCNSLVSYVENKKYTGDVYGEF